MLLLERGDINEIYNIGTDQEWSVIDVARLLVVEMTSDGIFENHVTFVADRPFNDFRYSVDSTRLRELGWSELHTDFKANVRALIAATTN
jgi:dTDP-D-glucose 4,6-dehydratase